MLRLQKYAFRYRIGRDSVQTLVYSLMILILEHFKCRCSLRIASFTQCYFYRRKLNPALFPLMIITSLIFQNMTYRHYFIEILRNVLNGRLRVTVQLFTNWWIVNIPITYHAVAWHFSSLLNLEFSSNSLEMWVQPC